MMTEETTHEPDFDPAELSFRLQWPDDLLQWVIDRWIQLLGIAFLLLGVGFLFKYSYEQGLLSPPLRVACGAFIGGVLTFAGMRLRGTRGGLARVLLGGASATFYITLFAASELYELIPGPIAFAGMLAVTMATFVAAVTERDAILANIATIGGYATPFVLESPFPFGPEASDISTLVYMVCVLAGATAIYAIRGWRSVVVTSAVAIWTFLALTAGDAGTLFEQFAVQLAVLLALLATGVAPTVRAVISYLGRRDDDEKIVGLTTAHILVAAVPVAALLVSHLVWPATPDIAWAVIGIVAAGAYAGGAAYLERLGVARTGLSLTHGIVSIGLLTMSLTEVLVGPSLMAALIVEATGLCWIGHFLDERYSGDFDLFGITVPQLVSAIGHAILAAVCLDSFLLLAVGTPSTTFFDAQAIQLFLTVAALFAVGQTHEDDAIRPGFEWAAHLLFLGAVLHQAGPVVHGDLIATAFWGVYSLAVITIGLITVDRSRQWMGVSALFLTAAKLIFVDMSGTETLWRVLLFIGFGIALLVLNYLAPRWTEGGDEGDGFEELDGTDGSIGGAQ